MRRARWIALLAGSALALTPIAGAAEPGAAIPAMRDDRIVATGADGRTLGTLILPSIIVDTPGRNGAPRPLLVVFNGGPGAASAWLQLGLLGPWHMTEDGRLEPNREGLWDRADILFVDPLGTGFSRARVDAPASVRGRDGDGAYLARAIRAWMDRHDRRDAPVVLMGESYGAERAVAVAAAWRKAHADVHLTGIALVSQTVLSAFALDRDQSGPLPANLPTMAATACHWHHRADPLACARATERVGDHPAQALAQLGGEPFARLATRRAGMTLGLFRHMAFARQGGVLGLYDSRQVAPASPTAPPPIHADRDPALAALLPRVAQAANRNGRMTLGLDRSPIDGTPYVVYDKAIRDAWRYPADPVHDPALITELAHILHDSGARLLVAGGVFDTVSSYAADRRLVAGLDLPPMQITLRSYPGGHMFYLDPACRHAFIQTLRTWIAAPAALANSIGT